ncbi:diguanylate cyclase/phosphodiesterase [Franzmannia pantelleriensis]|uniref:Diguanylate cyclase/phosphodiesterase n=1 Tax=Franzmannia pantelleriensis TaxID=48727 RepID=A0A1G9H9D9_9GAMM|nr:GGDEF domain-containing protein [Halomonas pantelleriensis]SDL09520.1 diguanylate cyclase/phosphodiesterase [Halomonas pantelleriensis]
MTLSEHHLLEMIIADEQLTPYFQPIVDMGQRIIHGYEALIRGPQHSPLHSPKRLFETAMQAGSLVELDLLCRRLAIQRFVALRLEGKLFLNVMPTTLLERDFREGLTLAILDRAGLSPERVVIELTEHLPIVDYQAMRHAMAHYREMGFLVALDDLGAGHSSLRHWAELRPDMVKLDRHFVSGIDISQDKREFLRSLLDVARNLGCQLIVEGIETAEEHRCLWELDRSLALLQGYYFARPSAEPPRQVSHLLPNHGLSLQTPRRSASAIIKAVAPVSPELPVLALAERFRAQPTLRCVPVVEAGMPVAVVRRHEFLTLFTNPYSHALHARSRVAKIADRQLLCVPEGTPLEALSQRITDARGLQQEDFVFVDVEGGYLGMGNIVDLLREITSIQVRQARNANPLTGLPGNILIQETLTERLRQGRSLVAVFADLDNFKAYNDSYGYAEGDRMILALSRLLLSRLSDADDFLGHVGGDDFMLLLSGEDWRATCEKILTDFAVLVPEFYRPEHRAAGGLLGENRQGQTVFHPLVSLSLAARPVAAGEVVAPPQLSAELSELKAQAKRRPGNTLFIDRRHSGGAAELPSSEAPKSVDSVSSHSSTDC